jgi:hypothetical protein
MQINGSGNPMNSGLAGIQQGQDKMTRAAQEIASSSGQMPVKPNQGVKEADLEKALLDQKQGQREVEVSAKVVQAGSQMIGSLVDLKV